MIVAHVVGIFQDVSGQDRDHGFARVNFPGGDEFADACHRGCGGRLAADAVAADDGFGVGDFLFADGDDAAVRAQDGAQRFLPGNGSANFYGGGERARIRNRRDFRPEALRPPRFLMISGRQTNARAAPSLRLE